MRPARSALPPLALALALLGSSACENVQLAPGEFNDIYVVADQQLWTEVGDTLVAALQPTVLTVTDEVTFEAIHIDPATPAWGRARTYKQLLLVGTPDDPWVSAALEEKDMSGAVDPPEIVRLTDVWALNQTVTVVVLPSGDPQPLVERLPDLQQRYEEMFRRWTHERMFISGRDSALADTLVREAGFSLLVPNVYDWDHRDSLYIFRNDNPSPDELIRQIMVTWRSPLPLELDPVLNREAVLEWRGEAIEQALTIPQEVDTSMVRAGGMDYRGQRAFELQAIWQNPPSADWPAAGPFVTRMVPCPDQDRLYLVDGWLYAPGRDKYEYMIQLETIMGSFRCHP